MSRVSESLDRIVARVRAAIDDIDAGGDPQPAIDRLAHTIDLEITAVGLAAVQDAVERTHAADDDALGSA